MPENLPVGLDAKFKITDIVPEDADTSEYDLFSIFDSIDKDWFKYGYEWLDEVEEIEGAQRDLDDWDIWKIRYGDIYEDRLEELLETFIYENDDYEDKDGMTTVKDIGENFLEYLQKDFDNDDGSYLEKYGYLIHEGHYKSEAYWRS